MTTAYVLAHFDDEYFALPMILEERRAGVAQKFLYVADYASADLAQRRLGETRAFLLSLGVAEADIVHVGAGTGALDGDVRAGAPAALAATRAALAAIPGVERLVVTAWEGGHPDHDACALIAVRLAQELGAVRVDQFALYSGRGLRGRLFRAGSPLPENGPIRRVRIPLADWARFALGVRFYPSQWKTWLGLWPTMFLTYLLRGFGSQQLAAGRVGERPHEGALLYERQFGVSYAALQDCRDRVLGAPS